MTTKEFITTQYNFLNDNRHQLVIDGDTHITDFAKLPNDIIQKMQLSENYFHGRPINVEQLLQQMIINSVDMSLCWQNPHVLRYQRDHEWNYESLLAANQYIKKAAREYPEKIIPGGWTDPVALGLERSIKLVKLLVNEYGFPLIKINPAQNGFPIDSEESIKVIEAIVECGAMPAFHFGSDTPYTPPDGVERIATRFSKEPMLAIHMGGGGASDINAEPIYQEARLLGLRNPNIHYVLSSKREVHMESDFITYQLAGKPFCFNLSCGSDSPFGNQSWSFGGFRSMFAGFLKTNLHPDARIRRNHNLFTQDSIGKYLGGNLLERIIDVYRNMI